MKTLLHVGCGFKRKEHTTKGFNTQEWKEIRLDIDPKLKPDVIGSITNMSSIKDESVDAVFSSHNIEHLEDHQVSTAFNEFSRVLKQDGILVITCPDIKSVCERVANGFLMETAYISPSGPIRPLDILFGHSKSIANGRKYMAHRTGFDKKRLENELLDSGFNCVKVCERPLYLDLWSFALKKRISEDEMETLITTHLT